MHTVFAVETKHEVAESAATLVQVSFDVSDLVTVWYRAPAHVVHLGNGVV